MNDLRVNLTDLSKYVGREPSFLSRLTLQGVIEKDANGLYSVEESKKKIEERLAKFQVARSTPKRNVPEANALLATSESVEESSQNKTYWTAKTRSEAAKAVMAELEYRERCKKLIEADKVEAEITATFRMLRDRLLALPDRLAHVLMPNDSDRCRTVLRQEIRQALEVLSGPSKSV